MAEGGFDPREVRVGSHADEAMPQDQNAENTVLGAMLLSSDILQEALTELREDDFYRGSNRTIFNTMRDMFDESQPVDPVSLADALRSRGKFEMVGGANRILDLGSNTLALANWHRHAEILRRDCTLRKIIEASTRIITLAYDAPGDTKEVVDSAERMLLEVTDRDVRSNYTSIEDLMVEVNDLIKEVSENQDDMLGVKTGFPSIDNLLLGMQPGQMVVVGARPGVGKTSFALSLAVNAAERGAAVALFSLEMSKMEVGQRLLAAEAKVGLQSIRSGHIGREDWPAIIQASSTLADLDIMVDDTPGTTITEVRAKARRMLHGKKKGLVVLDYLQLVTPSHHNDNHSVEVGEISRGVKIMAKDLGVPVVALSQLSRVSEGRTGKRPQLSDLRDSGSIEQDADIVILLDRSMTEEEAARDDRPDMNVTHFIVAKNRSGPIDTVPVMFIPGSTKFVELTNRGVD